MKRQIGVLFITLFFLSSCKSSNLELHILLNESKMETSYYVYENHDNTKENIFIIAGIHGNEVAGIKAAEKIVADIKQLKSEFNYIILPVANKEAAERNTRVFNMLDLNRAFPGNTRERREQLLAYSIFELIKEYKPTLVLDLHESYGQWNKDYSAIPNTFVIADVEKNFDLTLYLMENPYGFNSLSSPPVGSLNYEVWDKLNIPVITVETSMEDDMEDRVNKHIDMINYSIKFYE